MLRWFLLALTLAFAGNVLGSPPEAVAAALLDVRRLPPAVACKTRYFDLSNLPDADREQMRQALAFHVNSLSREPEIVRPREVTPELLAVNCDDYQWDVKVFGLLGRDVKTAEPYYHVVLQLQGGKQTAAAPWIAGSGIAELVTRTDSQVPIVRADWFINQTGIQADRNGHGYYDFLCLGKREKDFQNMIGADPVLSRKLKKETAAAVARSGVTLNNRSIARMQAITGSYWFTQDFKTSKDKQNTVRLLDFSTEPPAGDASEQYGVLPNGLFAFWLQNQNGDRQDSAPDSIASDGQSTSTDRRVHVGLSCIRCHTPGIQPIDDHARRLFQGEIKLVSPDYDKLKRLRQLYLSDLPGLVKRDQTDYAAALKQCNGLSSAANAKAYSRVWQNYEADLKLPDVARELGCTPEHLQIALANYGPALDQVIAGLIQTPPLPLRREHFEETVPLLMNALGNRP